MLLKKYIVKITTIAFLILVLEGCINAQTFPLSCQQYPNCLDGGNNSNCCPVGYYCVQGSTLNTCYKIPTPDQATCTTAIGGSCTNSSGCCPSAPATAACIGPAVSPFVGMPGFGSCVLTWNGETEPVITPYGDFYGYTWASGYKFRSTDSFDSATSFKRTPIQGGELYNPLTDLMAEFPVSQDNWSTTAGCRDLDQAYHLDVNDCNHNGQVLTSEQIYRYTCNGDVAYNLNVDNSVNHVSGGDTMYGAWSMLMDFFPPTNGQDCNESGRCFVGNAVILDTKAQNEKYPGLLPGFGIKLLTEGPGEVYYFDQVRSMLQPAYTGGVKYNNPVLVGNMLTGNNSVGGVGVCDGSIFEAQLGSRSSGETYSAALWAFNSTIRDKLSDPKLLEAYAAAQAATGIPCEILAGIHYSEGGMNVGQSLYDGGGIRGGSLVSDAIGAANVLIQHMTGYYGGPVLTYDFWGYVQGLTRYNGLGNLNCRKDDKVQGGCYSQSESCGFDDYVPTRWRCGGKCTSGMQAYDDSIYALSWYDERHSDMDIIFSSNGAVGSCQGFSHPPLQKQGPGALTVAYMVHEYLMGRL